MNVVTWSIHPVPQTAPITPIPSLVDNRTLGSVYDLKYCTHYCFLLLLNELYEQTILSRPQSGLLKRPVHVTKWQNHLATWGALYLFMAFALAFMAFILFMAFGAAGAAAAFMRFIGMVSELKVYLANVACWSWAKALKTQHLWTMVLNLHIQP